MTMIPAEAMESHIGILGKTGSGKSNLAKVIAEGLMADGQRVCAIDPTGTWWGIRLSADGQNPSPFSPVIFGGDHGDIPVTDQHGTVLAEAIGTSADSAVIDTQQMTVGQRTRFFSAFAEALLRSNRGPLHLVIDEAHLFAPQGKVNDPQSGAMLHAANNLVSLGRGRGLRIILISQRPAKLHKDSLTQVETLIAMRLIAPQDRAAVKDWVGEWADPEKGKEIIASLPSLPRGDAWVWSPQIDYLERKHFPLASTFDSGTAEANAAARELPPIDLAQIGERMDTIRQEAMANDPARLRARIAELEKTPTKATVDTDAVNSAWADGFEKGGEAERARLSRRVLDFAGEFALLTATAAPTPAPQPRPTPERTASPAPVRAPAAALAEVSPAGAFSASQRKVLEALALWRSLGKDAPTKAMVAMCSGYSHSSGGFGNLLSQLRTAGAIDYPSAGCVRLLIDVEAVPARKAFGLLLGKLSGPQRKLFNALLNGEMSKTELGLATDYSPSSGGFGNLLSQLKTLGLLRYPSAGRVALEPWVGEIA